MELKKGYKQTEVGMIPEDWELKDLSDVVDFLDEQRRPIKSNERKSGIYPYYGASGIIDFVNDYIFDEELILLGEDGENILSRNLPLAFRVNGKVWVNNHAHVLRPKKEINTFFLTEYLESLDYSLLNSGTAQPKLNKKVCSNIKVNFPPLPEQQAIAQVLSDTDALIQALEEKLAKKRAIKQGAMQRLLTPGEGWEERKLGEIGSFKNGINKSKNDFGFGYPFVNLMDIFGENSIDGKKGLGLINSNKIERQLYDLKKGDVLFIRSSVKPSGVGLTSLVEEDLSDTVFSGFIIRFRDDGFLDNGFKKYCFYTTDFRNRLMDSSTVSANTNINQVALNQLRLAYPKLREEQTRIATILSDMDAEIAQLEEQLAKYRRVKTGMMQELLTGRIRLV